MKPDEVELSIVLPVYNVERYLRECLDSIYNTGLESFEVIAIDDGSTDGSLDILKEYKQKYANLILISQENAGVSVARNAGVRRAVGTFVFFLDSDDAVTLGISIVEHMKDLGTCDIFVFDALEFEGSTSTGILQTDTYRNEELTGYQEVWHGLVRVGYGAVDTIPAVSVVLDGMDYLGTLKRKNHYCPVGWRRIYRRKFILDNGLVYFEGLSTSEDDLYMFESLFLNPRVAYFNVPVTLYRRRRDSVTGVNDKKKYYDSYSIILKELLLWKSKYSSVDQSRILNWIFNVFIKRRHTKNPTFSEATQLIGFAKENNIRLSADTLIKISIRSVLNLFRASGE